MYPLDFVNPARGIAIDSEWTDTNCAHSAIPNNLVGRMPMLSIHSSSAVTLSRYGRHGKTRTCKTRYGKRNEKPVESDPIDNRERRSLRALLDLFPVGSLPFFRNPLDFVIRTFAWPQRNFGEKMGIETSVEFFVGGFAR